ncbi:MAG: thiamine phosphate synthase [Proteobacteria bacterium]|nr:thiamine phosphate synthase [Pseudomonadota bacterium]
MTKKPCDTDIYCLTGEEFSKGRSNIEVVRQVIEAGVKTVQYREKEKSKLAMYRECLILRTMTRDAGVSFIVNDYVDLAMAVEADGVHVGQTDLPVPVIRNLTGGAMIIGLSTHSPEQAVKAVEMGADYIGVGPLFTTKTKKDVCAPVGLDYLDYVVKSMDIPFVVIGGIKEQHVTDLVRRGASCVAMITEIVGADDIGDKIRTIRNNMKKGKKP